MATRGFHGPGFPFAKLPKQNAFLSTLSVSARPAKRAPITGSKLEKAAPRKTVTLLHEPDRPSGSWIFGAGTAHHMALEVENDEKLAEQKGIYDELGYTDCSEIKDRLYFHSVYCRCPGGILVECAATVPNGFAVDRPPDQLGQSLLLPPWFEQRRPEIEAMLEPIKVPESNFPGGMKKPVAKPAAPAQPSAAEQPASGASRRTSAVFIGGDKPKN